VWAPVSLHSVGAPVDTALAHGYQTIITYQVATVTNQAIPSLPVNEDFTGSIVRDYSGSDWPRTGPNGFTTTASGSFTDTIAFNPYFPSWYTPTAVSPKDPAAGTKVDHWAGCARDGSTISGVGIIIKNITWQRYRGYGRHE